MFTIFLYKKYKINQDINDLLMFLVYVEYTAKMFSVFDQQLLYYVYKKV